MRNHLFIVTYGRTGSTLLQGILNAHPGIHIAGENEGLFYQLYCSLSNLDQYATHQVSPEKDTTALPFYGISKFPFEKMRAEILAILDQFFANSPEIITQGFKEVRYDMPDIDNYLDFLANRYENTQFIFLTRDHQSVAASGFYKNTDAARVETYLKLIEDRFLSYTKKHPQNTFHMRYEDLMSFSRICELFKFLGHKADELLWRQAASEKHSYNQKAVTQITNKSSFVFFDSSKRLIEACKFEINNRQLRNLSEFALTGVILPFHSAGPIINLALKNSTASHHATLGISSSGYMNKYPHNPLSESARFSFLDDPIHLDDNSGDYEMVATFENGHIEIIGRLFVSPDHTQTI